MTNCRNIIFALLLVCSLFGNTFAQRSPWHETWQITEHKAETSTNITNMEIDSVEFYEKLINEYNKDASYSQNVAGIIIGAPLSFIGSLFFITGLYQANTSSGLKGVGGVVAVIGSIPLLLIGVPVYIYNKSKYSEHKRNAEIRDAYQRALNGYLEKRYLENEHSMRLMVTPAVNLLGAGGGINAVLQF